MRFAFKILGNALIFAALGMFLGSIDASQRNILALGLPPAKAAITGCLALVFAVISYAITGIIEKSASRQEAVSEARRNGQ